MVSECVCGHVFGAGKERIWALITHNNPAFHIYYINGQIHALAQLPQSKQTDTYLFYKVTGASPWQLLAFILTGEC